MTTQRDAAIVVMLAPIEQRILTECLSEDAPHVSSLWEDLPRDELQMHLQAIHSMVERRIIDTRRLNDEQIAIIDIALSDYISQGEQLLGAKYQRHIKSTHKSLAARFEHAAIVNY